MALQVLGSTPSNLPKIFKKILERKNKISIFANRNDKVRKLTAKYNVRFFGEMVNTEECGSSIRRFNSVKK